MQRHPSVVSRPECSTLCPSDGRWIAYGYTRRQAPVCFSLFGCSRLRSSALAVAGGCRPCGMSGA
ncbi:MAG: hypothetical protein COC14_08125 [Burkholderiaceae bacterium]|nr:MAG: hypothetical protein COC14_08125 [Burkholderiaceae bacterium]